MIFNNEKMTTLDLKHFVQDWHARLSKHDYIFTTEDRAKYFDSHGGYEFEGFFPDAAAKDRLLAYRDIRFK